MKLRRILSTLLFGVGCAVLFIGLLATVLPMIQNDQLRLVLSSFEMPSENLFVSAVNSVMTYALRNCYLVMLFGAAAVFAGIMLMLATRNATRAEEAQAASRSPYAVAADDTPVDVPVWRASRAPEVAPKNPFADPTVSQLLTPGRAKQTTENNPFAAFAPAAKPKAAMPVASVQTVADVETLLDAYKPPVRTASAASSAQVSPVSLSAEASPVAAVVPVVPVAQPFAAAAPVAPVAPATDATPVPVAAVVTAIPVAPVTPATEVSTAAQVAAPAAPVAAAPAVAQVAAPVAPLPAVSDVAQPFATAAQVAPVIPQPEIPAVAAFPSVQSATKDEAAPKPGASQSGSRIVIRSTFTEAQAAAAASGSAAAPAAQPQPEAAPRPVQPAAKAPGSRIKSTMGKHS